MSFTKIQTALEPAAAEAGGNVDSAAILSLAISMKRIADALTFSPAGPESIHDIINAIRYNTVPYAR